MSSPIVIHVLRPYANEEEYLASERFSIESKTMLLIDQAPLPAETPIVFDVQLQNGQKPIRAEAKVLGHVTATAGQPGGLRVRFKRFGAATKAFIDRAVAGSAPAPAAVTPPTRPTSVRPTSVRPTSARPTSVRPTSVRPTSVRPALAPEPVRLEAELARAAADSAPNVARAAERRESSGIHRRAVKLPVTPINREELLERLRTRARAAVRLSEPKPDKQTG